MKCLRCTDLEIGVKMNSNGSATTAWVTKRIGDVGRVVTGKTPSTKDPDNFEGEFPFITIPDLDDRVFIDQSARTLSKKGANTVKSSLLPAGSVMMSCIATIGRCGITVRPCFTNQQINSVVPDDQTDAKFLFYVFTQLGAELQSAGGGGSVYTNVSKRRFSDIEVDLPLLAEQRRIADILGTLDDKIELNRRMNETLEEMARAIFKDWFVDFGPVRAKMEGRDAYLPEEIWRLFPDRLVDSELGEVPEGWGVASLEDMLLPINDRVGDADVPEFSCTNTGLQPRADRFKKRLSTSKSKNKLIYHGDLVFGLSRQILNFGLMRDAVGCVSPAYKVFRVDRDIIRPDLLERIMRLKIDYYYGAVSASSREGQSISVKALEGLSVVCPPKEVQLGFYRFTDNFGEQTIRLGNSIAALSGLRDSLLPGLVSGEINSNTKAKGDAHIDN